MICASCVREWANTLRVEKSEMPTFFHTCTRRVAVLLFRGYRKGAWNI